MSEFAAPVFQGLEAIFAEDWEWEMLDNPEFSSQAGEHDISRVSGGNLQSVSPDAYRRRAQHSREMVGKIRQVLDDKDSKLTGKDRFYASLFEKTHADIVEAIESCQFYLIPFNAMGCGGVLFSFSESVEWMRFESTKDFDAYYQRLLEFPRQIEEYVEAMREGLSIGIVGSTAMVRGLVEQCQEIIDGDLAIFRAPLTASESLDILAADSQLRSSIEAAIQNIKPTFSNFLAFFSAEYVPNLRQDAGCASLPGGVAKYNMCLKYHTTTNLTADEIHEIGLQEVARIESRFREEVLIPLGFDPHDFPAFVAYMQKDPQFYVPTVELLLDAYRNTCAKIQALMPSYFNEIPRSPLEITSAPRGPAAYYLAGTADGKRPGRFYVNVSHLEQRPLYEGVALSLHEAIPGHHHQSAIAIENENIPNVSK